MIKGTKKLITREETREILEPALKQLKQKLEERSVDRAYLRAHVSFIKYLYKWLVKEGFATKNEVKEMSHKINQYVQKEMSLRPIYRDTVTLSKEALKIKKRLMK